MKAEKIVKNKPTITRKELEGVLDCLINNELEAGAMVKQFEHGCSQVLSLKYALATTSLTAAYHCAFKALDIGQDSEIIIPSYCCQNPISALTLTGGKAVLVDSVDESPFPSLEEIESKITDATKAIVMPHTFGYVFDNSGLYNLGVPVIEDVSGALGLDLEGDPVGSKAAITVLSFMPEMLLTTGNGGLVATNNSKHFSLMREMRQPLEYAMTDFQAAMGISQLMRLKDFIKRRQKIAKVFNDALHITPHGSPIPFSENYGYQTFPVLFNAPQEKITKFWKKANIEAIRALPTPIHETMGFRGLDFPHADRLSKKLYSIPLYPTLTKIEIEKVSRALSSFI